MQKTLLSLMLFSISSCVSVPAPEPPIHWQFIELPPGEMKACLPEADVKALAERVSRAEIAAARCNP
jgi:hypothetical protein